MVTVAEQGLVREALEQVFIARHASFATGWVLERSGRTTSWVSPGGTIKLQTTLVPYEYRDPRDAAGFLGDAIEWTEELWKRDGDDGQTWVPVRVALKPVVRMTGRSGRTAQTHCANSMPVIAGIHWSASNRAACSWR